MAHIRFAAIILTIAAQIASAAGTKPLVGVAPLSARAVDSGSVAVIEDAIASELVKTGQVRVLEREQMDRILREQGFQETSCVQGSCSVEMGRLLSVNSLLTGSLGRIGNTYSLSLRMVDVGTGEVTGSVTKSKSGNIESVLTDLLPSAIHQLVFPADTAAPTPVNPPPTEVQSSGSNLGYWIAGGVVLVAGGATAAYFLLHDDKSSEPAAASNPAQTNTNVEITLP